MDPMDTTLLERWQKRHDPDAFTELVRRHSGIVLTACKRILRDPAQAEEVTQECFVELMQSRDRIRVSLAAWLHTIALRRSIDRIKGENRRRKREHVFAQSHPDTHAPADISQDEILAHVDQAIEDLPRSLRPLIIARFLEGRSHADLARQFGVAESTIRYRIDNGVERIRKSLKRCGIIVGSATLAALLSQPAAAALTSIHAVLGKQMLAASIPAASPMGFAFLTKALIAGGLAAAIGISLWTTFPHRQTASPETSIPITRTADRSVMTQQENSRAVPASATDSNGGSETTNPVTPQNPAHRTINGRVYDAATGKGIPGASIQVFPMNGGRILGQTQTADPSGQYTLGPLDDGSYTVAVDPLPQYPDPRRQQSLSAVVQEGKPVLRADFALTKGIRVAGTVHDMQGKPVAGAEVGAKTAMVVNPIQTQSDADGRFVLFMPAPADDLMLQAQGKTFESQVRTGLKLTRDGMEDLALTMDQPRTASIEGIITDNAGAGLKDLKVNVWRQAPCVFCFDHSDDTDSDGRFQVAELGPAEYAILITPAQANLIAGDEEYQRVTLAPGESRKGLEIVFGEKGGLAVAGRVVNRAGLPVKNAFVSCYGDSVERTRTDDAGAFRITGLKANQYTIRVEHPDYSAGEMSTAAGTDNVEILLPEKGGLRAYIKRADTGAPLTLFTLAYVQGQADRFDAMVFGSGRPVESTDGSFTAEGLCAGPMTVAAWAPGFAPIMRSVNIEERQTAEIELCVPPTPAVEGWVVNIKGEPILGAWIYFVENVSMDQMDRTAAAHSDAEGHFVLQSAPNDIARVCAYHPEYGAGAMQVPGEQKIVLSPPAAIDLHIEASDITDNPLCVYASYPDAPYLPSANLRADSAGNCSLTGLAAGKITLHIFPNHGPRHSFHHSCVMSPGQRQTVIIPFSRGAATLEGILTADGLPISQATLKLASEQQMGREEMECRTEGNGFFRFDQVWSGELLLTILRLPKDPGGKPLEDQVNLTVEDGQVLRQDIELSQ